MLDSLHAIQLSVEGTRRLMHYFPVVFKDCCTMTIGGTRDTIGFAGLASILASLHEVMQKGKPVISCAHDLSTMIRHSGAGGPSCAIGPNPRYDLAKCLYRGVLRLVADALWEVEDAHVCKKIRDVYLRPFLDQTTWTPHSQDDQVSFRNAHLPEEKCLTSKLLH